MNFFIYTSAVVISFCGVFLGCFLGWIAKDELQKGKKYLTIVQEIIFFLALVAMITFLPINTLFKLFLGIALLFFITVYLYRWNQHGGTHFWLYFICCLASFLLVSNTAGFFVFLTLVLLYGLPLGSLQYHRRAYLPKDFTIWFVSLILSLSSYFIR